MKFRATPLAGCLAATVVALAPFVGKAFHTDDTFCIRIAQQIVQHPLDYYGFLLNWYGEAMPVYAIHTHPPFVPYYLAIWGALAGWSELTLHISYIPVAMLLIAATFSLASRFTGRPALTTLTVLAMPVVLVSSTNVMIDMHLTAFYTAAVALWVAGVETNNHRKLIFAAVLMGLATLCKYFGLTVVPLLIAYTLLSTKRPSHWGIILLIPFGMLLIEQLVNISLYGQSPVTNAIGLAQAARNESGPPLLSRIANGVAFTGGCFAPAAFMWTLGRTPRKLAQTILVCVPIAAVIITIGIPSVWHNVNSIPLPLASGIQCVVFVILGLLLILLVAEEIQNSITPAGLLLVLWIVGTFTFTTVLNWSVTARSLLPLAAPAAVLAVRSVERRTAPNWPGWKNRVYIPVVMGAVLAFAVAWADYTWAGSVRDSARKFAAQRDAIRGDLYFQGHWGWQYYMEEAGFTAFDVVQTKLKTGDCVIVPRSNTNAIPLPGNIIQSRNTIGAPVGRFVAIMNSRLGAGFYSDAWGPMPFVFGTVPPDTYEVLRIGAPAR